MQPLVVLCPPFHLQGKSKGSVQHVRCYRFSTQLSPRPVCGNPRASQREIRTGLQRTLRRKSRLVPGVRFPPRKGNVDLVPRQLTQGVTMTFSHLLREGSSSTPCSALPQPFKRCSLAQSAVPLCFVNSPNPLPSARVELGNQISTVKHQAANSPASPAVLLGTPAAQHQGAKREF